jgi:hypothetical protein
MESLDVRPLRLSDIRTAYPLIRQAIPRLDFKEWRQFAQRAADPRYSHKHGVIVVQRYQRPHPSGLFCYAKEFDLNHGQILSARHFVVLDLFCAEALMAALIVGLEALGSQLHCAVVRTHPLSGASDVVAGLLAAGHQLEGSSFTKSLGQTSSTPITLASVRSTP